jgi:tetratricopeptide (TPR) repeat protein
MSGQHDHEIVPAIRDWLAATTGVELPLGLSRADARRRAPEFLAGIAAGTVLPENVDVDEELKDILWASVDELDAKPLGRATFEECDRFYQFVMGLRVENDAFYERDEVLHGVARLGWRSAPGGLEAVFRDRAIIWQSGDEIRHREICESADQLPASLEAHRQQTPDSRQMHEFCARLLEISGVRPNFGFSLVSLLRSLLNSPVFYMGSLDDREHLKASVALIAGMTARHLGNCASAESHYDLAEASFRKTADPTDLDRVKVERLANQYTRRDFRGVCQLSPTVIGGLSLTRERVKAEMVTAQALVELSRFSEAEPILKSALSDQVTRNEPAFQARLLTTLGSALSGLGRESEATASFKAAGTVLTKFHLPIQLADLVTSIGEHVARSKNLLDAVVLYRMAREMSSRLDQPHQIAYLTVLLAELLMLLGRIDEAEAELLIALPLVEKFDLRLEGGAAVALLRESLARRGADVTAIRNLRDQLRKVLD